MFLNLNSISFGKLKNISFRLTNKCSYLSLERAKRTILRYTYEVENTTELRKADCELELIRKATEEQL